MHISHAESEVFPRGLPRFYGRPILGHVGGDALALMSSRFNHPFEVCLMYHLCSAIFFIFLRPFSMYSSGENHLTIHGTELLSGLKG